MAALAHVVMHLSLCASMAHAPSGAPFHVTMHAQDRTGRLQWNREWTVPHGESDEVSVEFEAPQGMYRVSIAAPKYRCSAGDYLVFAADTNRNIKETLQPGPPQWREVTLLWGKAPQSFLYQQPGFVLLDSKTKCNAEVDKTLPADLTVEYDPSSFYIWLYRTPSQPLNSALLAMKVESATGDDQYVSLKYNVPMPWDGWPVTIEMNLPEGVFDSLATDPKGVLLCPKLYKTSAG